MDAEEMSEQDLTDGEEIKNLPVLILRSIHF
jgi:hypothetical protein